MAYPPEVRQAVRASYVNEFLPLEKAAEKHNIRYQTARTWKRKDKELGDDWDKARSARRMASGSLGDTTAQIIEQFVTMFQSTMDQFDKAEDVDPFKLASAMASLSDAFVKFMKAAGGGDKKIGELATAMRVLEEQAAFAKEHFGDDHDFMAKYVALLEQFGPRINEVFS